MVFQQPTLLPWRVISDNVLLPSEIYKLDKKESQARAKALLKLVGLEEFEHPYPSELSGGMQQRVAICRALLTDPDLLLMDEPFGALDALTRERMDAWLIDLWQKSGKTILFVTHSIPEAVFLASRVVVVSPRPGRVIGIVSIDLRHPRSLEEIEAAPEFSRCCGLIREKMEVC